MKRVDCTCKQYYGSSRSESVGYILWCWILMPVHNMLYHCCFKRFVLCYNVKRYCWYVIKKVLLLNFTESMWSYNSGWKLGLWFNRGIGAWWGFFWHSEIMGSGRGKKWVCQCLTCILTFVLDNRCLASKLRH